jgi:hypothetical protein
MRQPDYDRAKPDTPDFVATVKDMREAGATWPTIAFALGMNINSLITKYRYHVDAEYRQKVNQRTVRVAMKKRKKRASYENWKQPGYYKFRSLRDLAREQAAQKNVHPSVLFAEYGVESYRQWAEQNAEYLTTLQTPGPV